MSEAHQKAKRKYLAKGKRITIDFYPTEADLIAHVEKQPKKQTYIKDLIRRDMLIIKPAQSIELSKEEQIELITLATMEKDRAEAYAEYYKRQIYESRKK